MKYSLEIREEAVAEIVEWYDIENKKLGDAFINELYSVLDFIKKYP